MKKRIAAALAVFAAQSALFIRPVEARQVTATVYDPWYSGRTTACGQTYEHWGISAAHPWLPCGTRVRVNHKGRVLTVKITDRCECNSIDLSAGAAYKLGVPLDGIGTVTISY
ncbi:MAG: septal ring lytic transglycosylase RlpA family protein [Polynucleobacter sp.]